MRTALTRFLVLTWMLAAMMLALTPRVAFAAPPVDAHPVAAAPAAAPAAGPARTVSILGREVQLQSTTTVGANGETSTAHAIIFRGKENAAGERSERRIALSSTVGPDGVKHGVEYLSARPTDRKGVPARLAIQVSTKSVGPKLTDHSATLYVASKPMHPAAASGSASSVTSAIRIGSPSPMERRWRTRRRIRANRGRSRCVTSGRCTCIAGFRTAR